MELNKKTWNKSDILNFQQNFEPTLIGTEKECLWEQKIVNTKLQCFGKTSAKAKDIAKQILKGNYLEFIDNLSIKTHFDSLLIAYLICHIKDFQLFEEKLSKFVKTIDNWASTDTLKFQKYDKEKLFLLSKKFLASDMPFIRRVGVNIYFELIKSEEYVNYAFQTLDNLKNEKEYYVNMASAWLLCDLFVKHREQTIKYFSKNNTNAFIINKAISKCRDSFRVSLDDKNFLLRFKK